MSELEQVNQSKRPKPLAGSACSSPNLFAAQAHLLKEGHEMKFYKHQHEFYCGIDLHANSMHVCVVDQAGKKHLHKNFPTKTPERFLAALQPFSKRDLIVGNSIALVGSGDAPCTVKNNQSKNTTEPTNAPKQVARSYEPNLNWTVECQGNIRCFVVDLI